MEGGTGTTLEDLKRKMTDFAEKRYWDQFHSPRNLLLALLIHSPEIAKGGGRIHFGWTQTIPLKAWYCKVGEISEIFQWKERCSGVCLGGQKRRRCTSERSSQMYCALPGQAVGHLWVDQGKAAIHKMELNARKYPIQQCKSSSNKYNHYFDNGNSSKNNTTAHVEESNHVPAYGL